MQTQPEADPVPSYESDETVAAAGPEAHQRDEVFVLLVGFGIGMTIAAVFLVYIVLGAADLLK